MLHQPIDRTADGFVCEGKAFGDLGAYLKSRSAELRYNYDRAGVPLFKCGPLKMDLKYAAPIRCNDLRWLTSRLGIKRWALRIPRR